MADGEDEEEELKSPVDPKRGSITDDALVDVELKQLASFPDVAVEDEVGIDGIVEPL